MLIVSLCKKNGQFLGVVEVVKDTEEYPHHNTISNQQQFPQHQEIPPKMIEFKCSMKWVFTTGNFLLTFFFLTLVP